MSGKLLIIEDDYATIRLLTITLERKGYAVISADRGAQGLQLARKETPALIMLDLMLPGMDGLEVLDKLRKAAETKEIPVVILSSRNQKSIKDQTLNAGASAYITKPYNIHQLLEIVESLT